MVYVPELEPWIQRMADRLCGGMRPTSGATVRHVFAKRASSATQLRRAANLDEIPAQITAVDFEHDTATVGATQAVLASTTSLIGIEGAAFVNQLWLPAGSVLVIIHVPRDVYGDGGDGGDGQVRTWHAALAQYLGHHVVDWILPSNWIPWAVLVEILRHTDAWHSTGAPRQQCVQNGSEPLECDSARTDGGSAAGSLLQLEAELACAAKWCGDDMMNENFRILSPQPAAVMANRSLNIGVQVPCCIAHRCKGARLVVQFAKGGVVLQQKTMEASFMRTSACIAYVATVTLTLNTGGAWQIHAGLYYATELYDERVVSIHAL